MRTRSILAACAGLAFAAVNLVAAPGQALALTHSVAPSVPAGCLWAKAPQKADPVLTAAQAGADLHQTLKFGGTSGPVSNFSCTWEGKALPKVANPEAPKYTVQLWVDLYYSVSTAAARKLYNEISTGFGAATPVHGVGNAAAYMPGQDVVTTQIAVITGADVFVVQLSSTEARSTQDQQLVTVARQVVTRLAM